LDVLGVLRAIERDRYGDKCERANVIADEQIRRAELR
jgi:hypothetical protein